MFVDYGLPQPTFETIPGGFAVTVFANKKEKNDTEKRIKKIGEKSSEKLEFNFDFNC